MALCKRLRKRQRVIKRTLWYGVFIDKQVPRIVHMIANLKSSTIRIVDDHHKVCFVIITREEDYVMFKMMADLKDSLRFTKHSIVIKVASVTQKKVASTKCHLLTNESSICYSVSRGKRNFHRIII